MQLYRGIDTHKNLQTLMQKVKQMEPGLVLATGDLSEDGGQGSYRHLELLLNLPGVPVLALPGNHDDPGLLATAFPGSPVGSIAVSCHGPWRIIRLNSCLPSKPEGYLDKSTLDELEGFLASHQEHPLLVALHHQPVSVGSPWIDKYRLMDADGFLQLLDSYPNVKAVVWGHVHQAFETKINETVMLGGPSSAINGVPGTRKFTADSSGPAGRWLELKNDGSLLSDVF